MRVAQKGYWTVTARGCYWFANGEGPFPSLMFFDFATRKTSVLARGDAPLMPSVSGMSVSPDDAWVLYTRRDRTVRRILLAENFR